MADTLLAIHGTVTRPGRLYQAIEAALSGLEGVESLAVDMLHLGDHRISFADGRPLAEYEDDTQAVVERVIAAEMFLIATPVFRASFTGALKNLLDHVPVEGLARQGLRTYRNGGHRPSLSLCRRAAAAGAGVVRGTRGAGDGVPAVAALPGREAGRRAGHSRPAVAVALGGGAAPRCCAGRNGGTIAPGRALTPRASQPPMLFLSPVCRVVSCGGFSRQVLWVWPLRDEGV